MDSVSNFHVVYIENYNIVFDSHGYGYIDTNTSFSQILSICIDFVRLFQKNEANLSKTVINTSMTVKNTFKAFCVCLIVFGSLIIF